MRKRFSSLRFTLLFMMAFAIAPLFQSCKPSLPSDVLSEGKMEEILYDYHLTQAAAETERLSSSDMYAYRLAVLRKHEVTQAQFDSSMVYYTRHTELLQKVYENLYDRLNKEAVSLGATVTELEKFGEQSAKGDTANIWNGARAMVLPAIDPFNYYSFSMAADTSFHKGDRFLLEFDTKFLIQDGMRNGIALLAIQFANDSVTSQMVRPQNSQHYSLMVEDRDSLGIKKVSGYMMFNNPGDPAGSKTTFKLMIIQNIRLIKMHVRDRQPVRRPSFNKARPLGVDSLGKPASNVSSPSPMRPSQPLPVENGSLRGPVKKNTMPPVNKGVKAPAPKRITPAGPIKQVNTDR